MTFVTRATRLVLAALVCGLLTGGLPLSGGAGERRPTLEELRNASITGIADEPITLNDGVYEAPSRLRVMLWADLVSYGFSDGTLGLVSSVETGTLSLTALAGNEWTLVSLDEQPLPHGAAPPTIIFEGARVSGFGGCNRYTAQVAENAPGTITVGPLAATKMACPSPAMEVEDRYLAALGSVSQYTFVGGRLLLSGASGGASQRLLFQR